MGAWGGGGGGVRFGLHGHFGGTSFLRNSETEKIIFAILTCSDPQNVRQVSRVAFQFAITKIW